MDPDSNLVIKYIGKKKSAHVGGLFMLFGSNEVEAAGEARKVMA